MKTSSPFRLLELETWMYCFFLIIVGHEKLPPTDRVILITEHEGILIRKCIRRPTFYTVYSFKLYHIVKPSKWISVLIWWVLCYDHCLWSHVKENGRVLMAGHVLRGNTNLDRNGHVLLSISTTAKWAVNMCLSAF